MEDVSTAGSNSIYRQIEFYGFCVISFSAKSLLLIGLPYREWPVNTFYTCSLLLFFYFFFRLRQGLRAPVVVVLCLAAAVAVDILGNKFGLYGHPFGPLRDYDEFAHFAGSGFSAVGAFWLLRAATRRMGVLLSNSLLGFLSTSVAFTYCGWYEILELWDEYFWSGFERIHWWYDTPNDLFYDFLGVIAFIAVATVSFSISERFAKERASQLVPVRLRNLLEAIPADLMVFFITTTAFGLCCWIEIFKMFDQRWFGRIHFEGNRDSAINLQWEVAACVVVGVVVVTLSRLARSRKPSTA
ncbi:MAG TPA: hypothetical protein VLG74_10045 [Blastocatellia bacterium]|nr:hypothetical protein [Blastocatellia bacterium]